MAFRNFGGTPGIRRDPLLDPQVPTLNVSDFTGQVLAPGTTPPFAPIPQLAGRLSGLDKEKIKEYKDAFGSDMGAMVYMLEQQRAQQSDPQRMKEMLDVLGPYHKDVARENQRLGKESALFAGVLALPDRAARAMAASHYYMPETMQTIFQNIGRPSSFLNRQYTSL